MSENVTYLKANVLGRYNHIRNVFRQQTYANHWTLNMQQTIWDLSDVDTHSFHFYQPKSIQDFFLIYKIMSFD